MLREPAEPAASEPKQSGSFRYLQGMLEASESGKTPVSPPKTPNTLRPLCPLPPQCPAHPSPSKPNQSTPSSHPSIFNSFLCLYCGCAFTFLFPLHHPVALPYLIQTKNFSRLLVIRVQKQHPAEMGLLSHLPHPYHLHSGFQGIGLGPVVPGTSSQQPASWVPH